ncbi:SGNH/GDSL hydrolase family protein [Nocardioides sp. HDW12B]|uniref:SGNH/GDSL hydrolase family protein n=1 Tax=Nocardioides sp. HDW12B TaxID=2714939 RepID=UPI00140CE6CB|nr:SGNH/GDSL hydrolase family protein [Nocardioides sp. HDW12B]QIK66471.1 SGNH/GDSL hydrolase family protein [Nocardioides sp. HDW12B]
MTDRQTGQDDAAFSYDNRTGRGPGRVVRTLGLVMPGVRHVQRQVEPYADAWRARNRESLAAPGPRWFVLGDSMSQAVGASRFDAGWVDQLARRLSPALDVPPVVNLSATGARTPDLIEQQLPALRALRPGPDDLVTVLIGSNDLFAGRVFRDGLPDAFAELVRLLPRGSVVATLPQPRAAATAANRHLEVAAATGDLRLVDMRASGPTSWRGRVAEDRFHPNDAGYAAIADAFEPVVRAAVADPHVDR